MRPILLFGAGIFTVFELFVLGALFLAIVSRPIPGRAPAMVVGAPFLGAALAAAAYFLA
jgi:hypothetical protein